MPATPPTPATATDAVEIAPSATGGNASAALLRFVDVLARLEVRRVVATATTTEPREPHDADIACE